MANNALLPAKGKKKKKQAIPKTVQQTIPYVEAYEMVQAGRAWIIFQNIRI